MEHGASSSPWSILLWTLADTYLGVSVAYWVAAVSTLLLGLILLRWALGGVIQGKAEAPGVMFAGIFGTIGVVVIYVACTVLYEFSYGNTRMLDDVLYKVRGLGHEATEIYDPMV